MTLNDMAYSDASDIRLIQTTREILKTIIFDNRFRFIAFDEYTVRCLKAEYFFFIKSIVLL